MTQKLLKRFLDTEDGQIFYQIGGKGKPLILLHRHPLSSEEYRKIIPFLAKNNSIVAVDLLGSGNSDKPPKPYSIADYAKSIITLMDSLSIDTTIIMGSHLGSFIAGELAAAYGDRIEKIILCNLDLYNQDKLAEFADRFAEAFQIKADGSHLISRWSVHQNYAGSPELTHNYFLQELKCHGYPPYGIMAVQNYCHLIPERYKAIDCPTLLLSGTQDLKMMSKFGLSGAENRECFLKIIPRSTLVNIAGGTIGMINQMPEQIAKIVLDFLEEET